MKDSTIKTVQGGVPVKIRMHTAVLDLVVIQEGSLASSVIVELGQGEDLMIVDGVTMMGLAAVVTEVALANSKEVGIVAGVTNQMRMIGQNRSHQVNVWNRNSFLEATLGLTLRNMTIFQLRQQATTVLHTLKVSVMLRWEKLLWETLSLLVILARLLCKSMLFLLSKRKET